MRGSARWRQHCAVKRPLYDGSQDPEGVMPLEELFSKDEYKPTPAQDTQSFLRKKTKRKGKGR